MEPPPPGVDTDLPAHAVQFNDGALDLGDEFVLIQTPGGDEGALGRTPLRCQVGAAQVDKELDGVALDPVLVLELGNIALDALRCRG